ncbi:MAG: hypothetical protein AAFQ77_02300 [Myxococcota bacterium]
MAGPLVAVQASHVTVARVFSSVATPEVSMSSIPDPSRRAARRDGPFSCRRITLFGLVVVAATVACAGAERSSAPGPLDNATSRLSALRGLDTPTLSWTIDGADLGIAFGKVVVDTERHPTLPVALIYLAPEAGSGRISATDAILLDLRTAGWRTLGSGPAPVGWPEHVWSPDGTRLVALQDRFGPFVVLRADDAANWIAGDDELAQRFAAEHFQAHQNHPAKVHVFERWLSEYEFEFSGACCGDSIRYVADLGAARVKLAD